MFKKRPDGRFEKVDVRKRPGTVAICAAIMNHYRWTLYPILFAVDLVKTKLRMH